MTEVTHSYFCDICKKQVPHFYRLNHGAEYGRVCLSIEYVASKFSYKELCDDCNNALAETFEKLAEKQYDKRGSEEAT